MPRPTKDPLNRYATPTDTQLRHCKALAKKLAAGIKDHTHLSAALDACAKFATNVAEGVHWAMPRGEDAATIVSLEWMNALETALKASEIRAPRANVTDAFKLGYFLHGIPTWFGENSILEEIKQNRPDYATWKHLINLNSVTNCRAGFLPTRIYVGALLAQMQREQANEAFFDHEQRIATLSRLRTLQTLARDVDYNRGLWMHFIEELNRRYLTPEGLTRLIRTTSARWKREMKGASHP
jgi:hypothetical protein